MASAGIVSVALFLAGPAQAQQEVDVALVLAVDISYSMDEEEQQLQRQGYVEALRSFPFLDAVRRGAVGRIAVTYLEWAGTATQDVIVPWQIIEGPESADAFIDKLKAAPIRRAYRTSVSGGIDFAAKLFTDIPFKPLKRVIDVSGDGPNNQGRAVTAARDEAVARGITINGLPIMLKRPGYMDIVELDDYFRDCVIGGQGAFMVPIREQHQFTDVIRTKLILEVAGHAPPAAEIVRAQATQPRVSCLVGERQWNERMGN
ncbi:DUF1194 domain-containing protein [Chelatococcus sp. SYSU_G07232]|uniref:DUF1194 domain-containing protein n=1 Tax=Chelatococcus albus TaxID=3047466 RepID=A0ABT7ADX0_9HYPH|nr:DUF1194 domain-containing protein [Chelatococcus sp. SYSU_G07232]MDJ1157581.1 DUF1194 domain-containing protein [Chelatococcus sp. SYSU_G07232]